VVRESYETLASQYDVIILEGAGSPAEINLKQHDIVNMRMAEMANAACLLVGDIDRGGVFASLLGTCELLEPEERKRIRGFCINKFRGDLSLLIPGVQMMEERLGKPCLGVIPYLPNLALDEEDSVGLPAAATTWSAAEDRVRVAVVALPSFSNFTDFDSLRAEPSVELIFCRSIAPLAQADVVILPGSKQTMSDLAWLRENGFEAAICDHDGPVIGICGGMQMLGREITDPSGIEQQGSVPGLGLLPIRTTMQTHKITRNCHGHVKATGKRVSGYEIHVGATEYLQDAEPFAVLDTGEPDGCVSGQITGTYLHGIFDDDAFRHAFLTSVRGAAPAQLNSWKAQREESLNRLARTVRESLDIDRILSWVGL
jgi:adenosylcobyric acid synthase